MPDDFSIQLKRRLTLPKGANHTKGPFFDNNNLKNSNNKNNSEKHQK